MMIGGHGQLQSQTSHAFSRSGHTRDLESLTGWELVVERRVGVARYYILLGTSLSIVLLRRLAVDNSGDLSTLLARLFFYSDQFSACLVEISGLFILFFCNYTCTLLFPYVTTLLLIP
jgi:hypothetical protein